MCTILVHRNYYVALTLIVRWSCPRDWRLLTIMGAQLRTPPETPHHNTMILKNLIRPVNIPRDFRFLNSWWNHLVHTSGLAVAGILLTFEHPRGIGAEESIRQLSSTAEMPISPDNYCLNYSYFIVYIIYIYIFINNTCRVFYS